jgi:hypothetical protein
MRFLLIACCVSAVLATASSAAAERICLIAQEDALFSPPLRVDGPQSQMEEGENAASRPIDEIWSFVENTRLTFWREADAPKQDERVLWCEGGDQSRCSPQGSEAPAAELVPPPTATLFRFVVPQALRSNLNRPRFDSDRGPSGFYERLLRPPR